MVALSGTAFPDIRLIVDKDLETASWLFTGGSLGYMVGAFVGGLVFDRYIIITVFVAVLGRHLKGKSKVGKECT